MGVSLFRWLRVNERGFLEDGDEVVFRGYCERDGFVGIGLGECCGTVVGGWVQ